MNQKQNGEAQRGKENRITGGADYGTRRFFSTYRIRRDGMD